jgi:hypothetical protein
MKLYSAHLQRPNRFPRARLIQSRTPGQTRPITNLTRSIFNLVTHLLKNTAPAHIYFKNNVGAWQKYKIRFFLHISSGRTRSARFYLYNMLTELVFVPQVVRQEKKRARPVRVGHQSGELALFISCRSSLHSRRENTRARSQRRKYTHAQTQPTA